MIVQVDHVPAALTQSPCVLKGLSLVACPLSIPFELVLSDIYIGIPVKIRGSMS